jgi:hypothetical protein
MCGSTCVGLWNGWGVQALAVNTSGGKLYEVVASGVGRLEMVHTPLGPFVWHDFLGLMGVNYPSYCTKQAVFNELMSLMEIYAAESQELV